MPKWLFLREFRSQRCDNDISRLYLKLERVKVQGRGGTALQPGIELLEMATDFPKDGPILIITDGEIESRLEIRRTHAFLVSKHRRLPFAPKGKVFSIEE